jgi:hypothetical protein
VAFFPGHPLGTSRTTSVYGGWKPDEVEREIFLWNIDATVTRYYGCTCHVCRCLDWTRKKENSLASNGGPVHLRLKLTALHAGDTWQVGS